MSAVEATDIAVGVLRVAVGTVFVLHGGNHVFGGGRIAGTGRWFESLGMRPGRLHAWMASLTELGCGLLLAVGLLTPLAAAGLLATMVVAFATAHARNGFFIFRPGEGYEYVLVLGVAAICLGGCGGGRLTVDRALGILGAGWLSLLLTFGLGIVGGLAQLLIFWRPRPTTATGS
ncbi:DoxX family protein [Streptomyces sp. NPDC088194]|uniref:DoxX family protein n=1 Tax=Streptomyces sp. NPDC088194 TaxID=3154931 RepID=UPI00344C0A8E